MEKTILVTGGLGYIGSHAVVAFERAGYKTVIIDNLVNSNISVLDNISKIIGYKPDYYEYDLKEKSKIENLFKMYNFIGVIHFAGLKAVGESCEIPLKYFDNNLIGSIKLFELMLDYNVKNIIFSSSATVYKELKGERKSLIESDLVGDCTNPYGTTKFIIEQILKDLSVFSGFNVINLRYFNPIGAHNSGLIGERPIGAANNLLPYIMQVSKGELPFLRVFGNDYNTFDGTGIRDYIDVNDLIEGHLLAFKKFENQDSNKSDIKGYFDIYNLGTGIGVSVFDMLQTAENVIGKSIKYEIYPRRNGDLAEVYCDTSKAKAKLGFLSKISLEESILNHWKFYNK